MVGATVTTILAGRQRPRRERHENEQWKDALPPRGRGGSVMDHRPNRTGLRCTRSAPHNAAELGMNARRILGALAAVGLGSLAGVGVMLRPRPLIDYRPAPTPAISDVVAFHEAKVAESLSAGVFEGRTERLVLHRASGSDVVFLYLHGFSASRGEGEYVVDILTAEWSANTWYARLPGHGGPGAALGTAPAEAYFDTVTEAVAMAGRLGDKVVVIATSTGATLALWAAATYPDQIDALILSSPLIDFADPKGKLLLGGAHSEWLVEKILGENRDLRERLPGGAFPNYDAEPWMKQYPSKAVLHLEDVRAFAARPSIFTAVEQPTLMFYYYADDAHQDETIDITAARDAFSQLNGGSPHAQSRSIAIRHGEHVLFSAHKASDKDTILAECRNFLREVVGLPARERALRADTSPDGPPPG